MRYLVSIAFIMSFLLAGTAHAKESGYKLTKKEMRLFMEINRRQNQQSTIQKSLQDDKIFFVSRMLNYGWSERTVDGFQSKQLQYDWTAITIPKGLKPKWHSTFWSLVNKRYFITLRKLEKDNVVIRANYNKLVAEEIFADAKLYEHQCQKHKDKIKKWLKGKQ